MKDAKFISDWKYAQKLRLARTILETFAYLRNNHIVVGDIKGENIKVFAEDKTYFFDADSYAIKNYSCPVSTGDYMMNSQPETAIIREEQRRRIREVLDTTLTGIDRIIVWEKGAQGKGFPKILEILRRNGSTLTTPEGLSRRYQKSLELLKKHLADDR